MIDSEASFYWQEIDFVDFMNSDNRNREGARNQMGPADYGRLPAIRATAKPVTISVIVSHFHLEKHWLKKSFYMWLMIEGQKIKENSELQNKKRGITQEISRHKVSDIKILNKYKESAENDTWVTRGAEIADACHVINHQLCWFAVF